jgi:LssY C-terminus
MKSPTKGILRLVARSAAILVLALVCPGVGLLGQTASPTSARRIAEPEVEEIEKPGAYSLGPALAGLPRTTQTHTGIPGDPLNVALVATENQLVTAMIKAGWLPADPITLRSSLRIAASTVFHRSYPTAPVSNLYVWKRKEDLAFERSVGTDPRRRNHVRFWRSEGVDEDGRPLWVGAATFDTRVEISRTTGFITHRISPAIDRERDKLLDDLGTAGKLASFRWIDNFQENLAGRNGSGDPYHTDGRMAVGIVVPTGD